MANNSGRMAGGVLGEHTYSSREGRERPVSDLVKDIISNLQAMVRSEMRLAKAEVREEAAKTMAAAKLIGAGAGFGLFAAGFLLTGITLLLAMVMPAWLAALLVGAVLGIMGAVLFSKGRARLTLPMPDKTIANVKENVEWTKNQIR